MGSSGRRALLSLFTVDPGMDTGWAWTCFLGEMPTPPRGGVISNSGSGSMKRLAVRQGEIPTRGDWKEEAAGAKEIWQLMCRAHSFAVDCAGASSFDHLLCVVVVEGFSLRERTREKSLLSPVRLTSGLHQMLFLNPDTWDEVEEQSPSDKSIITDEILEAEGVYLPGKPHSNDAHRHRLLWERKRLGVG